MDQIIEELKARQEAFWENPDLKSVRKRGKIEGYGFIYVKDAQNRFMRFLPYIASAFPETASKKGIIESSLISIPKMQEELTRNGNPIFGKLFLKDDAHLPIAGSVKARGGIHEVLKLAETLALKEGMIQPGENYEKMDSEEFRHFFSQYTVQVGSTGNLGVSIGRTAARFGFQVIVHMSADARGWKKDLLRQEGVIVKEYDGDYSQAVAAGRAASMQKDKSFFVDDENSEDLFFGYSTAALRLKIQLLKAGIKVDQEHPLFVYLPCGVGGAPGGITFGLKEVFGDFVHCFFVEPIEAPCMTLGMASGKGSEISVQEIGLTGKTIADGLAVGRASGFSCRMMKNLMSGVFTASDQRLEKYQEELLETEGIFLEPSACAGFLGVEKMGQEKTAAYLKRHGLNEWMSQSTQIVWGTGGGLMEKFENDKIRINC